MSKLSIQPEKCIACGKCYLNFPEVFDCDDEGIAFVQPDVSDELIAKAERAIYECPTKAISKPDSPDAQ